MRFEKIQFASPSAQKIYDQFIAQVRSELKPLSEADQQDLLMEINSHVFEGMSRRNRSGSEEEIAALLQVIDRIGVPGEIIRPIVAERKLVQATKTFNPWHVMQALALNMSKGVVYVIFAILYFLVLLVLVGTVAKILYPGSVGFFYKDDGNFLYGVTDDPGQWPSERLGAWFIPINIAFAALLYFIITGLLRLQKKVFRKKQTPASL